MRRKIHVFKLLRSHTVKRCVIDKLQNHIPHTTTKGHGALASKTTGTLFVEVICIGFYIIYFHYLFYFPGYKNYNSKNKTAVREAGWSGKRSAPAGGRQQGKPDPGPGSPKLPV